MWNVDAMTQNIAGTNYKTWLLLSTSASTSTSTDSLMQHMHSSNMLTWLLPDADLIKWGTLEVLIC